MQGEIEGICLSKIQLYDSRKQIFASPTINY